MRADIVEDWRYRTEDCRTLSWLWLGVWDIETVRDEEKRTEKTEHVVGSCKGCRALSSRLNSTRKLQNCEFCLKVEYSFHEGMYHETEHSNSCQT